MKILELSLHLLHYLQFVLLFSCFLGIIGHERINRAAVMALPKPLQTFFLITSILLLRIYRS
jgi:hypothetical protein